MAMELRSPNLRDLRSALGISQESLARVLDVSVRSVERWEAGAGTDSPETIRRLDALTEIARIGRDVYGDDLARFMSTPRRSLGQRTPTVALMRGELDDVLGVLAQALEGQLA